MAAFSSISLSRLEGVKSETMARALKLNLLATQHGIDIGIAEYGGKRTLEQQQQLAKWEADSAKKTGVHYAVATPGKSKHETGDAFDIFIASYVDDFPSKDAAYKFLADLAPSIGLRAGYYFKRKDEFHFENVQGSAVGLDEIETPESGEPDGFAAIEIVVILVMLGALFLFGRR